MDNFDQALQAWIERVNKIHYGLVGIQSEGKKYIRIATITGQQSVVCFIDKEGNVLFPAGWKTPTKHNPIRGNIWEIGNEGIEKFGCRYIK